MDGTAPARRALESPMRCPRGPGLLVTALLLQGCAALGVTGGAVALAAMGEGAGAIVKAGTEYRAGGVAYRTFTVPLDRLHEATRAMLTRMDLELQSEQSTAKGRETVATARERGPSCDPTGPRPARSSPRPSVPSTRPRCWPARPPPRRRHAANVAASHHAERARHSFHLLLKCVGTQVQ